MKKKSRKQLTFTFPPVVAAEDIYIKYLIHLIRLQQDIACVPYDTSIPLRSEILKKNMGRKHYERTLKKAISEGWVLTNGFYLGEWLGEQKNTKFRCCRKYRLADFLFTGDNAIDKWQFRTYRADKYPLVKNIIDAIREQNEKELDEMPEPYQTISRNLKKVYLDETLDCGELEISKPRTELRYDPQRKDFRVEPIPIEITKKRAETLARNIMDGSYYFKTDQQNRLHTNVSGLTRECLQFLRFRCSAGDRLVQLDLHNSHPYFLALFLRDNFSFSSLLSPPSSSFSSPLPYMYASSSSISEYKLINSMDLEQKSKGGNFGQTGVNLNELDEYSTLVSAGLLYADIGKHLNISDRDLIKDMFFHWCYGSPKLPKPVGEYFREKFPLIEQFIRQYNIQHRRYDFERKRNDWGKLSREIMLKESEWMYQMVVPKLMSRVRDCLFQTRHDALIVSETYWRDAKQVILETFEEIGLSAAIGITQLWDGVVIE